MQRQASLRRRRPCSSRSSFIPCSVLSVTRISLLLAISSSLVEGTWKNTAHIQAHGKEPRAFIKTRSRHWSPGVGDFRGGGIELEEDSSERNKFWSLGALFRLNADAKDDASQPSDHDDREDEDDENSLHLRPGNGRGGALAVRTPRPISRGILDTTRVATAASRLIEENDEGSEESIEDEDEDGETDDEKNDGEDTEEETIEHSEATAETARDSTGEISDVARPSAEVATPWWTEQGATFTEEGEQAGERPVDEVEAMSLPTTTGEVEEGPAQPVEEQVAETLLLETPTEPLARVTESSSKDGEPWWVEDDAVAADDYSVDTTPPAKLELTLDTEGATLKDHETTEEPGHEYSLQTDLSEVDIVMDVEAQSAGQEAKMEIAAIEEEATSPEVPARDVETAIVDIPEPLITKEVVTPSTKPISPYVSSGYWTTIDRVVSLGLSTDHPSLRISRRLRAVRKAAARATGLHGILSGKGRQPIALLASPEMPGEDFDALNDEDLGLIRRRIAVIEKARENVERKAAADAEIVVMNRRGIFRRNRNVKQKSQEEAIGVTVEVMDAPVRRQTTEEFLEEQQRKERVKQIDKLIAQGQADLMQLQIEKDALQRRPNPLYNYTATKIASRAESVQSDEAADSKGSSPSAEVKHSRNFNFPPQELVDEYLSELLTQGRLVRLNHTYLWQSGTGFDDDEDESIGDDLLTPSADARKLYKFNGEADRRNTRGSEKRNGNGNGNGGGGSWLLRQSIGRGGSLGEKIGETIETAAYKAVCAAVMSVLARSIAAIHGVNVMTHSDVRLYVEDSPDLPPVGKSVLTSNERPDNYAQEAILDAMRRGVKKHRKRGSRSRRYRSDETFIQRDAVVETLISHCQISAPLLKLFPLAWQRALLGNIITLIAAVVSDFCDGIQLQILGHQLSFSFKPITEDDMIRHIGMAGNGFNHRRARPEQFEAAVAATAEDVSENLKFLDRWHERALGGGMLRAQIANLIARIVLTLTDEVLSGARMDLWSAQAGGPRMLAGLEYRTSQNTAGIFSQDISLPEDI